MTPDFTQGASRLAGTVCVLLHWTPSAFWNATPAEISALSEALQANGGPAAAALTTITRADLNTMMEQDSHG